MFAHDALPPWEVLIGIAFALWQVPDVVNIGWGTNWKAWPRYAAAGIVIVWVIGNCFGRHFFSAE